MALSFIACDGEFDTTRVSYSEVVECNGELVVYNSLSEMMSSGLSTFDYSSLDPAILGGFFGAGFTLVGSFMILGKVVSTILRTIKEN